MCFFIKDILRAKGFYTDALDGIWGLHTNKADAGFVASQEYRNINNGSYSLYDKDYIALEEMILP